MACHRSICRVFSSAHDGIVALCVYTCTRKDKMLSGVPAGIFAFLRLIHSRVATDLISLCFAESFELSFFPAPQLVFPESQWIWNRLVMFSSSFSSFLCVSPNWEFPP